MAEGKDLRPSLTAYPGIRRVTGTKADVRETLLGGDARMTLQGEMWDIRAKHLAAGIYEVWLELHEFGAKG